MPSPGLHINGGTIPPEILITQSRPDLVLLNGLKESIWLLELTCSFEGYSEVVVLGTQL